MAHKNNLQLQSFRFISSIYTYVSFAYLFRFHQYFAKVLMLKTLSYFLNYIVP